MSTWGDQKLNLGDKVVVTNDETAWWLVLGSDDKQIVVVWASPRHRTKCNWGMATIMAAEIAFYSGFEVRRYR